MKLFATLALAALVAIPASAVELRFWPSDPLIAVGENGFLSVMLDDTLNLRTIELWVHYDDLILQSDGGAPGGLFEDTGCMIWWEFENPDPGSWHGFAVILDAYCWTVGPGELFRWNFTSLAGGYSRVEVNDVRLFDENGDLIDGVTLGDTYVFVGDDVSSVPGGEPLSASWGILKLLY